MALFITEDEGKVLGKKQVKVPDKIVDKLKLNRNLFAGYSKAKGYKRINSIIDDDYNKRSNKKDKIHNGDKTVSFSDLKRIDFDLRHTTPNKNNLDYVLQAPLKQWANDELKKLRTSVKKVKGVPPVPKLEKDTVEEPKLQKDIKMGNATIRLTESQLLLIKEYHDQLVFNSDENGDVYFKKNNYENYIDFLEEIGRYGQLPKSEWSMSDIEGAINDELDNISLGMDDISSYEINNVFYELLIDSIYVNKTFDKYFNEEFDEIKDRYMEFLNQNGYVDAANNLEYFLKNEENFCVESEVEADTYLTDEGFDEFNARLLEQYKNRFYEYDMLSNLNINDRGLIYMEREIIIPKATSPYTKSDKTGDYFRELKNSFCGIGNCFSWYDGGGEAYCGNSYGAGNTHLLLKCWVDPKDVNWGETVYRNCYYLNGEMEIYVDSSNAKIEVFEAVLSRVKINGKVLDDVNILKKPIIVSP